MKNGYEFKWILIDHTAASLFSIIADGKFRATKLGRQTWKNLIRGSSLQLNCNREGFNVNTSGQRLRIGIATNNEKDCSSNDSSVGLGRTGAYGTESCGNVARHGGDNGNKNIATWGYIFVR